MNQEQFDALDTSMVIERTDHHSKQTLGLLDFMLEGKAAFNCRTLELPWLNNQRRVSCIPIGFYEVIKRQSTKYGECFLIRSIGEDQVEGRDWILIHPGNYYTQILGCVLVGKRHIDINKDGLKDVTESKATMRKLLEVTPDKFYLQVKNAA